MTADPTCASVNDSAAQAARMMRDRDCGSLPVSDATRKVVGMITDRDLAVRGLAEDLGPDALVSKLMTLFPHCCGVDDDVQAVEKLMADHKVRRVPVVDENQHCVGIIAQADLAQAATRKAAVTDREVALVVQRISSPGDTGHRVTPKGVDPYAETLLITRRPSDS
jgi:predicted transcriptional regulator